MSSTEEGTLTFPHPSIARLSVIHVDWHVDVLVASELLNRVAVPVIVLQLTLSNQQVLTFSLSQEELHQFRFTLAKAVKDLSYLEKKRPPAASKRSASKSKQ